MAHLIETMAYAGDTPWHNLGQQLPPTRPLEVWAQKAGMDWTICQAPVHYMSERTGGIQALKAFEEQKVLYRSDTKAALSVVSSRYQVVQPQEVLEFYRDLTEVSGYEMETAGVLKAGRKFWALARTGQHSALKGSDMVQGYLLLATSCDGSLATTVTPTTVRVVCHNTLTMAIDGASGNAIRVPHSTTFDAEAIKRQLGIAVSHWDSFMYRMKALSERKVKTKEALEYFGQVLNGKAVSAEPRPEPAVVPHERAAKRLQALYEGQGRGAELAAAKGTAWGLLNAVTEYVDHERRARSREYRLDSAWFGQGAVLKQRALDLALELTS
ncbi:hypothetical protein APR50_26750 [Variovorax paradoxus]|jgi:phage/plasmid-like protein (TIGR03299 family)|uniref:DUF932 domain-containing protein n=1 Tax=Variovorax paradoxus TaxID=34073 RepID=UPI0006E4DAB2|nr:hypothetical protein APR49_41745 [Variovorax paradoxus]KPV02640.1 hypothetical protein APR50_26750 [Variovorax paradoxus]KPV18668.1 hypothetical protein APR51_22755 [Variovorax paradoxus]